VAGKWPPKQLNSRVGPIMFDKKDPPSKQTGQDQFFSELLQQITLPPAKGENSSAAAKSEPRPAAATPSDISVRKPNGPEDLVKSRLVATANSTFQAAKDLASREMQARAEATAGTGAANKQPTVQYMDDHGIREIFADSLNSVHSDGQTLRIEFGITRAKRTEASAPQAFERLPACRLVLSGAAITELKNILQKISTGAPQSSTSIPAVKDQK
jgi:hypothetical protein